MSMPAPDAPLRILVVEDEPLVAMEIEDILRAHGIAAIGPVASVAKALELILDDGFDGALLDVNLRGQRVDSVADALVAKGAPFVFITGHGLSGLPEDHRENPMLTKPFRETDLIEAVVRHLRRR